MPVKAACSRCGAEISAVPIAFGMSRWHRMLMFLPLIFVGASSMLLFSRVFIKGDFTKDLEIIQVEKRLNAGELEIIGQIRNIGNRNWSLITIEAEFFDANRNFMDERQEIVRGGVLKGSIENFKITIRRPNDVLTAPDTKMELKIAGAHSSPFQ